MVAPVPTDPSSPIGEIGARIQAQFEQAPFAVSVVVGPEFVYEAANRHYEAMVGRTAITGKSMREVFPELPPDAPVLEMMRRVYADGVRAQEDEYRVRLDRHGKTEDAFFKFTIDPLRDAKGEVFGAMTVAVDVTGQVIARRAAEAASTRFALLAQVSTILNEATDHLAGLEALARVLIPVVGDFCTVSLVTPEGRIHRLADASIDPETARRVNHARTRPLPRPILPIIDDVLTTGRARLFREYEREVLDLFPADDPYRSAVSHAGVKSVIFAPLRARGRSIGYLTVGTVTNDRTFDADDVAFLEILAERAALPIANASLAAELRRSEERHRLTFARAPVGVACLGADGYWLEVNTAFCAITGYSREEIMALSYLTLTHPEDVARDADAVRSMFAGERDLYSIEKRYVRKDGSAIWVHLTASVVRRDDGEADHCVAIIEDIDARKRADADRAQFYEERAELLARETKARADAEAANRLKDQFLATMGHELRTPLNAILGWAQILRSGSALGPERTTFALETIERNARAQAQLIDDLLDVSRIMANKLSLDVHPIDMAQVVSSAIATLRPSFQAKNLDVAVDISADAIVLGDGMRLNQIALNLLSNAIKFTPTNGSISVSLTRGENIVLTVTDTGQGIAPEFLPRVFDRFEQAEGGNTRRHGGLGLGLAISRSLVELHQGTIRAESAGQGKGATFTVELRRASALPKPTSKVQSSQIGAELRGRSIVVVDDDEDARVLLTTILERAGAEVRTSSSAGRAIAFVDDRVPDVVITDIAMPGEDGFALLRAVRAIPNARTTLVVALSAHARSEDREIALRAGFDAYLTKPLERDRLIDLLVDKTSRRPP